MLPLEGMSDYIDISTILNPWQALVVTVFLVAVLIWPGVQSILTNRKVKEVKKTLTTNNSGHSVKDQLDRFEDMLREHIDKSDERARKTDERLMVLERRRARWPWTR